MEDVVIENLLPPSQISLNYVSSLTDHFISLMHISKMLRLYTTYYRDPIIVSLVKYIRKNRKIQSDSSKISP